MMFAWLYWAVCDHVSHRSPVFDFKRGSVMNYKGEYHEDRYSHSPIVSIELGTIQDEPLGITSLLFNLMRETWPTQTSLHHHTHECTKRISYKRLKSEYKIRTALSLEDFKREWFTSGISQLTPSCRRILLCPHFTTHHGIIYARSYFTVEVMIVCSRREICYTISSFERKVIIVENIHVKWPKTSIISCRAHLKVHSLLEQ